ncbi:SUMF1/EgtB/PvdO family nonheme iron enzyme [Accumulibacter sp.]|uniref:nSTAND1 domain-containing NTPase n=2 Tax=Accumulibacter sp. TaxID=2053492 RepID=UPI0025DBA6DF|nr:SUMF1/EgtB/PvdO family nonheme iron enzyme [Accumulibacter sp.]MCM8663059.1 SUMF1/EgtB/PvdO family nonheme iron enzyme [Accumulibacter sp.]
MIDHPPRVFISYAQESDAHSAWVLALARRLRDDGVEAVIDRYAAWPEKGWRPWMSEQIEQGDWVLVVCTDEYRRRFDGNAPPASGRGVRWESQHMTQALYDDKFSNKRFVPVLPPSGDERHIPLPLKDYRNFRLDNDYEALYRLLTDQPATPAPALGKIRRLPPLEVPDVPQGTSPPPAPPLINPYPGLAAFKPEERRFFFGRQADSDRVIQRLEQTRFVSLVGGSGTGKSSLIAAGVEPALRERHPRLSYLRFKPQADPLSQLAAALDGRLPEERVPLGRPRADRLRQLLEKDPARALADSLGKLPLPVLLFADQFEELFTQTRAESVAASFRALIEALRCNENLYFVLTLRREFMPRLMDWLGAELFETSLVCLDPIREDDRLREIIVCPAEQCGVGVQSELLEELLPAAKEMAGALPLLAMTLAELFERRDPEKGLTPAGYREMGGLKQVVETAAAPIDELIESSPALARASERLFAELATVIEELPTRRTAEVAALRADREISVLVDALRAQGFLADPDERHIELAHETLLSHWPRLQEWCGRYGDKLALRRQAEQAAGEWLKARQKEDSSGQPAALRRSYLLRWKWERQKPALEALLALDPHRTAQRDPDFADSGIDAWRSLQSKLHEPLQSFLAPEPLRLLDELLFDETPHHRREEIGLRLNQMGDPRRGVGLDRQGLPDIVWIDIPGGEATLESEQHETFAVHPFRIARYPVTWQQYSVFVDAADGYRNPRWWDGLRQQDQPGESRWGFANYPAIHVSWYDAVAFCRWLSARLALTGSEVVRLPAEWEWQWVAQSGAVGREYPWASRWNPMRANSYESGIGRTAAVGMYPRGVPDPWPVLDLAGNVWEWCLNEHAQPSSTRLDQNVSRVLRGGSWLSAPGDCRAALRYDFAPDGRSGGLGFRVCCGAPIEPLTAVPLDTVTLSH